jgi:hypothetical protein
LESYAAEEFGEQTESVMDRLRKRAAQRRAAK